MRKEAKGREKGKIIRHVKIIYCIIYKQANAAKNLKSEAPKMLQDVFNRVNYIKTRSLKYRKIFKHFS